MELLLHKIFLSTFSASHFFGEVSLVLFSFKERACITRLGSTIRTIEEGLPTRFKDR
jgi:hypothetical protein